MFPLLGGQRHGIIRASRARLRGVLACCRSGGLGHVSAAGERVFHEVDEVTKRGDRPRMGSQAIAVCRGGLDAPIVGGQEKA